MTTKTRALTALLAALLVVGLATTVPTAKVPLALAACLFLPGTGWARRMRISDRGDTVALAVVLSIGTTVTVGTAMAMSGTWSLGWGLAVLGGITVAGFVPTRAFVDRAAAVLRRPTGKVDEEAWAAWYAQTPRQARVRRREAGVAGADAAAIWVDWSAGVQRRAEQARARKAAAAQQAIGQWIAWYQLTQLRTSRQESTSDG